VVENVAGAKVGLIGYGTSHWAIAESRDQLREETDVKTSYFRLRAYPFTEELVAFIDAYDRIYVIEQNRDAYRTSRWIVIGFAVGSIALALVLGYAIARRMAIPFLTGDPGFAGLAGVEFVPRTA
jgi:pyruvate/2-oxoacid:ferredoxin oxidoreductase alpha subunit